MKYKFTKIDEDTTELSYKDKIFTLKKDVDLLTKMESLQVRAKRRMIADLTKDGLTIDDLQITKQEGNKTIVDKSNILSLEKDYLDIVSNEILNEITTKYTEMSLLELLKDIEINISEAGSKEQEAFIYDLLMALRGDKTPSKPKIEPV